MRASCWRMCPACGPRSWNERVTTIYRATASIIRTISGIGCTLRRFSRCWRHFHRKISLDPRREIAHVGLLDEAAESVRLNRAGELEVLAQLFEHLEHYR